MQTKKLKTLFLLLAVLFLGSCATQKVILNGTGNEESPDLDKMQSFFVQGIGQTATINAARVCGGADKVAGIETKKTFLDGLLYILTLSIYTPRTAKAYCLKA